MIDIHSLSKAPIASGSKPARSTQRVGTQNTSIAKQLPSRTPLGKQDRRKKDRRLGRGKVLVDLRSGKGRRASDHESDSHVDINV